jgi:hypothetical protein
MPRGAFSLKQAVVRSIRAFADPQWIASSASPPRNDGVGAVIASEAKQSMPAEKTAIMIEVDLASGTPDHNPR